MDRSKKEALVAELQETFHTAKLVVVTRQSGMTVSEVTSLRGQMREAVPAIAVRPLAWRHSSIN